MSATSIGRPNGNETAHDQRPHRARFACRIAFLLLAATASGFHPPRVSAQGTGAPTLPPQAVQVDGELEVQYEDSDAGSRLMHYLHTNNGQRLRLQFTGRPPDLLTGARVRARGGLQGNTLTLSGDSSSITTLALASSTTFGVQNAIVILINFQDQPTEPYTLASAQDVTFNQTSNFYLENSYGQTWLAGTAVGWFTIAANSTTCDTSTWASLADQAATNAGVSLADYNRRIYGFPQTSACSWWGLGTVGGNPSRSWINGTYSLRVLGHELGHNFGDYHSHSSSCDSTTCTAFEYGDDHDIMGGATAHLNAFQKERLGWLNYGTSPAIQTVSTSNDYWIDNYETIGSSAKALKIWNPVTGTNYYVESRARVGFDGSVAPGVVIHTASPTNGGSSYQIDMAPTTTTWDPLLDVGQLFEDTAMGLNIETLSTGVDGAMIRVALGTIPCVGALPAVSLSSSAAMRYTVSVTNRDGAGCNAAPFTFSSSVPSGWTASFNPAALSSLAPGSSATSTMTLTAPSGTSGTYSFSVNATNGNTGSSGTATASLVLVTSLNVTASASFTSTRNSRSATIGTSVKAGILPVAGAAVTVVITKPGGGTTTLSATTATNGTASVKYSLKPKDPSGTYQVQVTATSNGANGSSTTSFTVP